MATAARIIPRPAARRRVYVAVAVLVMAIAFVGFWTSYFGPLLTSGSIDAPAIIHFHATIYVGWLLIFLTQAMLAAGGRVAAHTKLGNFAIGYGVLVIAAGLAAAFGMFALRVRDGNVVEAQGRLLGPLLDMIVFAPLFAAAIYNRRRPDIHKRLMVVATTYLLVAAVGRLPSLGPPRYLDWRDLIWAAPILLAMVHDWWRQRRMHPIYVAGVALIIATGQVLRVPLRGSEAWRGVSGWLAGWVA